ncbi:MAG: hypothetical protein Q8P90_00385 [bacterium]|nr:hypothetical protein [bacterium]
MKYNLKNELLKIKKGIFLLDKIAVVLVFTLLGIFSPEYVVMVAYAAIIGYLFISKRKILLKHLWVATGISVIWLLVSKNQYGYAENYLTVFGYNLFPLFTLPIALLGMYVVYAQAVRLISNKTAVKKSLLFLSMYWPVLIIAEFIGYNWLNIHNQATAMYSGLPFCNCFHAPLWMQISYFSFGPLFMLATYLIGIKNPYLPEVEAEPSIIPPAKNF